MGIVLVELRFGIVIRETVEIGKEVALCIGSLCIGFAATEQVVDEHFRVNFLLNIEWWHLYNEVRPVLLVFAAPDKLRVEVTVATVISNTNRALFIFFHDRLMFGCWNIFACCLIVPDGFDFQI